MIVSMLIRSARSVALVLLALVLASVAATGLYAYGQSVGRDQVVSALDAGTSDARAAFDPAKPEEARPGSVDVPSPTRDPGGLFDLTKDARKRGGLWLAIAVIVFAAANFARARMTPRPGEDEPDPKSWQAKAYAVACAAAAVAATLIDIGFGSVGWSALAMPIAAAVTLLWSPFVPAKGSAKRGGAQ